MNIPRKFQWINVVPCYWQPIWLNMCIVLVVVVVAMCDAVYCFCCWLQLLFSLSPLLLHWFTSCIALDRWLLMPCLRLQYCHSGIGRHRENALSYPAYHVFDAKRVDYLFVLCTKLLHSHEVESLKFRAWTSQLELISRCVSIERIYSYNIWMSAGGREKEDHTKRTKSTRELISWLLTIYWTDVKSSRSHIQYQFTVATELCINFNFTVDNFRIECQWNQFLHETFSCQCHSTCYGLNKMWWISHILPMEHNFVGFACNRSTYNYHVVE